MASHIINSIINWKFTTVVLDDYSDPKDIRKALEQEDCYSLPQDSTFDAPSSQIAQPPENDYSVPYEPQKRPQKEGGRVSNGAAPVSNRPSYHGKPKPPQDHPEPIVPPGGDVKTHHNGLTLENGRLSPRVQETIHAISTMRSEERQRLQSTPDTDSRPGGEYDEPWEWQMRRNRAKEEATSPTDISIPRSRSRSDVASLNHGLRPTPETDNRPPTEYDEPWEWKRIRGMNQAAHGGNREHTQMSRSSSCSNKPSSNLRLEITRPKPDPVGEYVDPNKALQEQGWYHGKLSRSDAEKKLKSCREGSYLVRQSESSAKDFSLSLKSAKGYMHMKIVLHQEGYILGEFSKPFKSIPCVISHYSLHKLNIKGAEHMMLLYAVHDNLL
ncbi:SH2 domain-containing adapter protein F-like isoform X2 [Anneissia japonica]|uniref:SH2 domain-containing adapter protein F-like isoform X2 n=1 Tax=Anneissia japonica TaxID=1529436 RepID=UPI0014256992|nr:SH2 domain-containing adapter protein F-like isoform X2 [Anneissia japonica]